MQTHATVSGSTVAYHKVPDRMNYREMKRWWLPYAAIFYGSVCIITGECYADSNNIAMLYGSIYFLTLLFLGISLAALHYHAGGMTSIPLNPPILVLHDAKGPVIIAEIMEARRQEMMKAKLARVDFNRPYYEEAGKFSWLREEGIISEQEYRAARQKIAAMRDKAAPFSPWRPGKRKLTFIAGRGPAIAVKRILVDQYLGIGKGFLQNFFHAV